MSNKYKEKGNALEKAVKLIQETILKADPKFAGTEFTVEANVIKIISGVRHEIDVLVKTHPSSLYEATWIFECKNWNKPVGKNEVVAFSEKVKVLGANRGFLVVKNFTKDAEAQIKLDDRLKIIPFTDEFLNPSFNIELIHKTHDPFSIKILLKERGVPPIEHPRDFEWKGKTCRLNNQIIDFLQFIHQQIDQLILKDQKENANRHLLDSTHAGKREVLIRFEFGELIIGDFEVEHMAIEVQFWVTIRRRKIVSKFELKGQGRVFSFEPFDDWVSGEQIQVDIVQRT
jgi:hypothetical protein